MSINELESKARELRQLQALIEEAQQEAEAIKAAIKAAMGDSESVQAGEYRNHLQGRDHRQNRHRSPEKGSARSGRAVHQDYHRPPLLRSMRKAPCPSQPSKRTRSRHQPPQGGR